MARFARYGLDRPNFHHPTGIHHGDPIGRFRDHAHIMRDQHDPGAVLAAQAAEQRSNLRLDGNIQRRRRLIRDDQARFRRQRQCDDHALAHAARELVRILIDPGFRRWDTDFIE